MFKNCHCEERSDEAISQAEGLLRFARNDKYNPYSIVTEDYLVLRL